MHMVTFGSSQGPQKDAKDVENETGIERVVMGVAILLPAQQEGNLGERCELPREVQGRAQAELAQSSILTDYYSCGNK